MAERVTPPIDDCWNRIGVRGDLSCPRLREHVHCRNCPVYTQAARKLLDREVLSDDDADADADAMPDAAPGATAGAAYANDTAGKPAVLSALAFRLGNEWLALPTSMLSEVATMRPVHTLPRQRDTVNGVCNIRGRLLVCISLPALLGLETESLTATQAVVASGNKAPARLLVINSTPRAVVAPVDEVEGIRTYDAATLRPVPPTLGADHYTAALAHQDERAIGILDGPRVMRAIARSLA